MTGITYPNQSTNAFTYNGLDTRVGMSDPGGSKSFLRDGVSVTSPVLSDGSATYTPAISERRSSTTTFYHAGIKNGDSQTNTSESVTASIQYDAFGNVTSSSGTWSGPFAYGGPYGYQSDSDSGLKLLGHRYYDSSTGRFLTRDPAKSGRNWFGYCDNNPLRTADPTGLFNLGEWIDENLLGGAVRDFGDAWGRWEIGEASGWEVAGRGVVAAYEVADLAVDIVTVGKGGLGAGKRLTKLGLHKGGKEIGEEAGERAGRAGVYHLIDQDGVVRYVGSTNDFVRRKREHKKLRSKLGLHFEPLYSSDDAFERVFREQEYIDMFGGITGGQLFNKRNALKWRQLR